MPVSRVQNPLLQVDLKVENFINFFFLFCARKEFNHIAGSIPSELGKLTAVESLVIGEWVFCKCPTSFCHASFLWELSTFLTLFFFPVLSHNIRLSGSSFFLMFFVCSFQCDHGHYTHRGWQFDTSSYSRYWYVSLKGTETTETL